TASVAGSIETPVGSTNVLDGAVSQSAPVPLRATTSESAVSVISPAGHTGSAARAEGARRNATSTATDAPAARTTKRVPRPHRGKEARIAIRCRTHPHGGTRDATSGGLGGTTAEDIMRSPLHSTVVLFVAIVVALIAAPRHARGDACRGGCVLDR